MYHRKKVSDSVPQFVQVETNATLKPQHTEKEVAMWQLSIGSVPLGFFSFSLFTPFLLPFLSPFSFYLFLFF